MSLLKEVELPYYAVIFTSIKSKLEDNYYHQISDELEELAKEIDGYLGIESCRNEIGITVSYWKTMDAIAEWRNNWKHIEAKEKGREKWYESYTIRIALVEKHYSFNK
jgi:heme-degrading monooxygenase HmoA